MLALQHGAGNRAALTLARRASIARRALAPPGPVGEIAAGIAELDLLAHWQAVTLRELAPGSAGGAGFDGYETSQEAAVAAGESQHVGVVVIDDAGRFHAYETDLEPVWGPLFSHVVPYELPVGRVVQWTHLRTAGDAASWAARIKYAHSLERSGDADKRLAAAGTYVGILTDVVGLAPADVHDSTGGEPVAGKVSFNLDHPADSKAHAGVAGAIPSDRDSPLPVPTLVVGPGSFGDLASLRGTLLHEFTHLNHATKTIAAVERWRASPSKLPFLRWLNRQLDAGKVDALDVAVISEQVTPQSETTESLSYLRGFMTTYHLRDLGEFEDGAPENTFLFQSLGNLADYWLRAGQTAAEQAIVELLAYRETTMDAAHRVRFDAYVARRFRAAGSDENLQLFWKRLMPAA